MGTWLFRHVIVLSCQLEARWPGAADIQHQVSAARQQQSVRGLDRR